MKQLIFACLVLIVSGCASRKKEVQQHKSNYSFSSQVDSTFSFSGQYRQQQESREQQNTSSLVTRVNYDGKKGDSLSIKKFGPDGKLQSQTLITGSGKADITEESGSATRNFHVKSEGQEHVQQHASGKHDTAVATVQEDSSKMLTTKGLTWGFWLFFLIILLVLIGRWYLSRLTKNDV